MKRTWNDIEMDVIRWSEARQIIQNSTAWAQYIKGVSEMGELGDAILKKDKAQAQDGVGDVLVCLINLCAILDLDMCTCLDAAYNEIKDRKGYMNSNGVFIKETA